MILPYISTGDFLEEKTVKQHIYKYFYIKKSAYSRITIPYMVYCICVYVCRGVNTTLTVPMEMLEEAKAQNINISQTLRDALKDKIKDKGYTNDPCIYCGKQLIAGNIWEVEGEDLRIYRVCKKHAEKTTTMEMILKIRGKTI